MKNIQTQPTFYFSAYPLKALNLTETEKKTYLHIYSNTEKSTKRSVNTKVFPMVNPYKNVKKETAVKLTQNHPDHIQNMEDDWFASYE